MFFSSTKIGAKSGEKRFVLEVLHSMERIVLGQTCYWLCPPLPALVKLHVLKMADYFYHIIYILNELLSITV